MISLLYCSSLQAMHKNEIKGKVYDTETQVAIIGCKIELLPSQQTTFTDELGQFSFQNVPKGEARLIFSFLGYEKKTITINIGSDSLLFIEQKLFPKTIDIPEISIQEQAYKLSGINSLSTLDLQLRPVNNSQTLLRSVPGLFIAQHAGGGKAEQIFLRGFDIDHGTDINLSVDGIPVNMVSHAHGQGYSDLHFIIPETVERIDFAKGMYDSRFGNFATAGYAAFQTMTAPSSSMLTLEGGQFGTARVMGLLNLLPNSVDQHAYVAVEHMITDGYFESPQNFDRTNVFAKYTGLVGNKNLLSVSLSSFRSQWDASGQIPVRAIEQGLITRWGAIDDTEGGNTSRSNLNLQLTTLNEDGSTFKNQFYISRYDFELFSNFTFFLEDPVNGDQIRQSESRLLYGYNSSYQQRYRVASVNMTTSAGLNLRVDKVDDVGLSRTLNRTEELEKLAFGDVRELNAGVFVDQQIQLSPRWNLDLGLRYDHFRYEYEDKLTTAYDPQSENKGIFSPKASLGFQASSDLRLFVKGGRGFHSNDTRVIINRTSNSILPGAWGTDIGFIYKPFPKLLVQSSLWGLWLEQEFVYVGDAGIVEPSGKTRRLGADLSLRYQILDKVYLDGDLTYTYARSTEEEEGNDYIPLAPEFTATAGIHAKLSSNLDLNLRYRTLSDRAANEDNSVIAEGFHLFDVTANYRLGKLTFSASIENIFDVDWREAQFDTESLLQGEETPVSEIHFTPGTPFFAKMGVSYSF